jgi:hypothetical protein
MTPPIDINGTDISGATIDGTEVQEITVDGDVVFTSGFSGDINRLYTCSPGRGYVREIDFDGNSVNEVSSQNGNPMNVESNGNHVYVGGDDGIAKYDLDLNQIDFITNVEYAPAMAFAPNGNMFVVDSNENTYVYDENLNRLRSGTTSVSLSAGYNPSHAYIIDDTRVVFTSPYQNGIGMYDYQNMNTLHSLNVSSGGGSTLAINHENSTIWAIDRGDNAVRELDFTLTEQSRYNFSGSIEYYNTISNGPNNIGYVTSENDKNYLVDLSTGNITDQNNNTNSFASSITLPDGAPESGETIYTSGDNPGNGIAKFTNGDMSNTAIKTRNDEQNMVAPDVPKSSVNGNPNYFAD